MFSLHKLLMNYLRIIVYQAATQSKHWLGGKWLNILDILVAMFFVLDLSHNKIGDSGTRAVGKLLNGRCILTTLNLCDNKIRSNGAAAIGHNTTLSYINLRLNR